MAKPFPLYHRNASFHKPQELPQHLRPLAIYNSSVIAPIILPCAWAGHVYVFHWLCAHYTSLGTPPQIIVELGSDFGGSALLIADTAMRVTGQFESPPHLYMVDAWEDEGPSHDSSNNFNFVSQLIHKSQYRNITVVKAYFNDFAAFWKEDGLGKIDILHIDGTHTYEAVKEDFETWFPLVADTGLVMMHDMESTQPEMMRFYNEIVLEEGGKCRFENDHGLGIVSRDAGLMSALVAEFAFDEDRYAPQPANNQFEPRQIERVVESEIFKENDNEL